MRTMQGAERSTDGRGRALAMLVGVTLTLLWGAASAEPIPVNPADGCGQTLSAAGDYVLTGDLVCSGAVSGIIIDGSGVTLDLGGHTISNTTCDPDVTFGGIFVRGGGILVMIEGGTVVGFNDGIILSSSQSSVRGVTVTGACGFGIVVQGFANHLWQNVVTASGSDGIILSPATWATVISNNSSGNGRAGVALSDSSQSNVIANNILNDNEGFGVAVFGGGPNVIDQNVANNNANGIVLAAPSNFARFNLVTGSLNTGISIEGGASPGHVNDNTVLGSGVTDMSDGTAACGLNQWQGNTFETDLVAGVSDGGPGVGCI